MGSIYRCSPSLKQLLFALIALEIGSLFLAYNELQKVGTARRVKNSFNPVKKVEYPRFNARGPGVILGRGRGFVGQGIESAVHAQGKLRDRVTVLRSRHVAALHNAQVRRARRVPFDRYHISRINDERAEDCLSWCQRGYLVRPPFLLVATTVVRISVNDPSGFSTRELRQWLYYMRYAGFEHVYLYDAYVFKNESQMNALKKFIEERFVTYIDWSDKSSNISFIKDAKISATKNYIETFGNLSMWQAFVDMNEYPFNPSDLQPNFVQKILARLSVKKPPPTDPLVMKMFPFVGRPFDDFKHPLLIDRIKWRLTSPKNDSIKLIYNMKDVLVHKTSHTLLPTHMPKNFTSDEIRLYSYSGVNVGKEIQFSKAEEDRSMEFIVRALEYCATECVDCVKDVDFIFDKVWH